MKKLSIIIIVAMLATAISCKKDEVKPVASFTINTDSIYTNPGCSLCKTTTTSNQLICTNTSVNAEKYVWVSTLNGTRDTTTSNANKIFQYFDKYDCGVYALRDTITLTAIKGNNSTSTFKVIKVDGLCFSRTGK